jgi:hypothetical protein
MKSMFARVAVLLALAALPLAAHDVITTKLTWSRDISRIFAQRCVSCHRARASIPLTTYEQVRPWAVDIKEQVLSRAMPPWGAVKGFGDLSPDNALSQEEMLMIAGWVIGGAPEGDPALASKAPPVQAPKPPRPQQPILQVDRELRLTRAAIIGGLEPLAAAASAKITATLPDGSVVPLVWLYKYDPASKVAFRFAKPLRLPAGSLVAASSPLRFALTAPSPAR